MARLPRRGNSSSPTDPEHLIEAVGIMDTRLYGLTSSFKLLGKIIRSNIRSIKLLADVMRVSRP